MNQAEVDSYREYCERTRLVRRLICWTGIVVSVAIGLAVGYMWSFLAGIPLACILAAAWDPVFHRLDRAMQVRRFPELATANGTWRRTTI
jgi:predicted PurR-regulated permease PerM